MRAERKAAREQILSDLRNKSAFEKNSMRWESEKNRDKKPRFEEGSPKNFDRWQNPNMGRPNDFEPGQMRNPNSMNGYNNPNRDQNRGHGSEGKEFPPRK